MTGAGQGKWNNIDSTGATNLTVRYSIDADPTGQQFAAPTDLWSHQTATGLGNDGYGTISGGTEPADTDRDGMPDSRGDPARAEPEQR